MNRIRNFCIIAHIDHGKSTLADRFLEATHTIDQRVMKAQLLDSMEIERERGITIKLTPVRMQWKGVQLNLIDTPGHIDFNYEVSRSLAAVEGAILLVDATQGIEAQTLANLYLALEQNLTIIPVINKIDLPAADVAKVKREIRALVGPSDEEVLCVSAKSGEGVEQLLDALLSRVPAPDTSADATRALIFDAQYNEFKGVVVYVRMFGGRISKNDQVRFARTGAQAHVLEVGYFKPDWQEAPALENGQIGYLITSIKEIEQARVGDTVAQAGQQIEPLQGYRDIKPMVFAGIFPEDGSDHEKLRRAMLKLKLNDASLAVAPDHSEVLGFGFRCGFLGMLHLEVLQERLRREFTVPILVTAPTVAYHVRLTNGRDFLLTAPSALPPENEIAAIEQPMVTIDLITPKTYMGVLMEYIGREKGVLLHTEFLDETRVILKYRLPLTNIIINFYDRIKNLSSGYASYTYEYGGYEACSVDKLEILIAEERVPALTTIVPSEDIERAARSIVKKLKEIIPRAQFIIKIQAAVGGRIVASERLSALRKDVTAKLYGGDVTRKRKLLEKQKKGKKKMALRGSVAIPHDAYLAVLKRD